jgi:lipoprotein-releasing system ATP-binding protein
MDSVLNRVAALFETQNVSAVKPGGAALSDLSLTIPQGGLHILAGDEGCGKNLLLRIFGLLDRPLRGEVFFEGAPTTELGDEARTDVRNRRFGYVFRAPFLLGNFSAIENVAIPLFRIARADPASARQRSEELLEFVGLGASAKLRVDELPRGEQLRVALARSLVNAPAALFVEGLDRDEQHDASGSFTALLRQTSARFGATIVATAPRDFCPGEHDRRIVLAGGRVESDRRGAPPSHA